MEPSIENLRIVAATLVEDGHSDFAITSHLIEKEGADRFVAEYIAKEIYGSRQKHFRFKGFLIVAISGIVLLSSLALNTFMGELMTDWNRWSAHQIGGWVKLLKVVLWAISLYLFLKGILCLLLGGKGVQSKRPI